MSKKEQWSKVVRIFCTPPLLAVALLFLLAMQHLYVFSSWVDFAVSVICLGVFPLLAYPTARFFPIINQKGREGERELAFVFCLLGYTFLMLYGICFKWNPQLLLISETYFFSGWILALFNAVFHVRASGHSCGTTGPILLAGYLLGWQWATPFTLLFLLAAWASITLKRHTRTEFFMGSICCIGGFFIAWVLIHII